MSGTGTAPAGKAGKGRRRGTSRLRGWLLDIALLVGSTLLVLSASELVWRLAAHRLLPGGAWLTTGSIFIPDVEPMGYTLRPGATRILTVGGAYTVRERLNSMGLRDVERTYEKAPGSVRVLVLGDSQVYGQGVPFEEIFPRRLDRALPGIEVINAGIPGYNLEMEYLFYGETGRRFRPDLVLLGLFVNDLEESTRMVVTRDERGLALSYRRRPELVEKDHRNAPRGLLARMSTWLRSRSLLYTFVRSEIDDLRYRLREDETATGESSHEDGAEAARRIGFLSIFHKDLPDRIRLLYERGFLALDALKRDVEADGGRLALVFVPVAGQLSQADFEAWIEHAGADAGAFGRRRPNVLMGDWCARTATPCLDLLDVLEGQERGKIFFEYDLHLNSEGHRQAAQAILGFLGSLGIS